MQSYLEKMYEKFMIHVEAIDGENSLEPIGQQ